MGPSQEPSWEALRSGDETAFAALVRLHHPDLLRFATVRAPSRAIAEDVVQETWLQFVQSLDRFEGRSSIRTFLFGILLNVLRARARREARTVPFSALAADEPSVEPERFAEPQAGWAGHWSAPPTPWPSGEDALVARQIRETIESAIAELPDEWREVITLRDGMGWDASEIAELLGLTDGNVRVILHRARARLRAALEKKLTES